MKNKIYVGSAILAVALVLAFQNCSKGPNNGAGVGPSVVPNPFPYLQISNCVDHFGITDQRTYTTPSASNTVVKTDELGTFVDAGSNQLNVQFTGGTTKGVLCYYVNGASSTGTITISKNMKAVVLSLTAANVAITVNVANNVKIDEFPVNIGATGARVTVNTNGNTANCPTKWPTSSAQITCN